MPKNLEGERLVRRKAGEIPPTPSEDLARLLAIQDAGDVDTSDIPDRDDRVRLHRDADGNLPPRHGAIREAVASEMGRQVLSVYALAKAAKVHAPTISETAVGEFLKGRRSLGIALVEALLSALGLEVVRRRPRSKVGGTIQFLWEESSASGRSIVPIGEPHQAMFLLVETPVDETIIQWGGVADVACDIEQVTKDAAAAGVPPVQEGWYRDLGEFRARIMIADGRKGAIYIRKSLGEFTEDPPYHRLDFIGVSDLGL